MVMLDRIWLQNALGRSLDVWGDRRQGEVDDNSTVARSFIVQELSYGVCDDRII